MNNLLAALHLGFATGTLSKAGIVFVQVVVSHGTPLSEIDWDNGHAWFCRKNLRLDGLGHLKGRYALG